jgi:hypothetical protein
VIGAETAWLIGIGVLSLAAFIGALAGSLSRPLVILTGFVCLFFLHFLGFYLFLLES